MDESKQDLLGLTGLRRCWALECSLDAKVDDECCVKNLIELVGWILHNYGCGYICMKFEHMQSKYANRSIF